MSGINFCADGGWLTGGTEEFPPDPSHFFWPVRTPSLGCTRLQCERCGEAVRSEGGWRLKDHAAEHTVELFDAADWGTSEWVESEGDERSRRVYVCRCEAWQASYPRPVSEADEIVELPWRCAGHPLAALPLSLDGIEVRDDNVRALVARNYGGWVPEAAPDFHRRIFRFWTLRLYGRVFGTPEASVIAHAAMGHLLDPSPAARHAALHFTWTHPTNEAAEALSLLEAADVALFAGQTAPEGEARRDLGAELKKTIFKRNAHADRPERDRLRPLLQELARSR